MNTPNWKSFNICVSLFGCCLNLALFGQQPRLIYAVLAIGLAARAVVFWNKPNNPEERP